MANTPINAMTATFGIGDQTAILMNVTDSGPSDASSKLIDLQIGGTSKFKVTKEGYVTATNYTGSVSGSVYVKNSTSLVGYSSVLFVSPSGDGRRVLRTDSTSFLYDAANDNLTVDGTIYAGISFETNNTSFNLLSNPQSINFGASATDLIIGSNGVGTYSKFLSNQVRARNFTGSFTGSISGSNGKFKSLNVSNLTASISGSTSNFTRLSGSNAKITGRVVANSFTGSISASLATLINTNISKLSGSNARISGKVIATNFTGSISGSRANFTKLSGSNAKIEGRVVAKSFTGSFSGSVANIDGTIDYVPKFTSNSSLGNSLIFDDGTNIGIGTSNPAEILHISSSSAAELRIQGSNDSTVQFVGPDTHSFTLGLDVTDDKFKISYAASKTPPILGVNNRLVIDTNGNVGINKASPLANLEIDGNVKATDFTGSFSGSLAKITNLTGANIYSMNRVTALNFSGSASGSRAIFTRLSGSNARISGRVIATSFTGSITGTRGFFTRITSSTARFTIRAIAPEFSGSISGSKGIFTKLSGSNAKIVGRVIATSFTGSISGSRANFTKLSGSNATIEGRVIATSFTGSISGSNAVFVDNVVARSFTGSISGSKGIFTQLTSSNAKFISLKVTNITSSISGSINVSLINVDTDLYVPLVDKTVGQSNLYTDGGIQYNPFRNECTIDGNLYIGYDLGSTSLTTASLFRDVPQVYVGNNSNFVNVGNIAPRIKIGGFSSYVMISGSLTGSTARFNKFSSSRARIERLTSSRTYAYTSSIEKANINYLTSSNNKLINTSGSTAYFTTLTGSTVLVQNDIRILDDVEISGSLKFRFPLTGSGPSSHKLFISGAGALQGYMGIMINGTKYKIPLYAW